LDAETRSVESTATGAQQAPGLRGKLWLAFVVQIAAISIATLLSVYGAWVVLRDVLIRQALTEEASHYWQRLERDPDAALPDTFNLLGYLDPPGDAARVPKAIASLEPGYHALEQKGRNDLVYVSRTPRGTLYLVFKQEQVDRLALWFGFVPLSVVLVIIYITTWITFRVSRRAVSPVIWLANQVRSFDPKRPDLAALEPRNLPRDTDGDVRTLAGAIHGFAARLEEFVDRERNFTRDASHELRSPLTVIKIAADVLEADAELPDFAARSVARIRRATRDMEALLESFLILAREADVGLPEEDFVVNDVVHEEVEKAQALVAGRPLTLEVVEPAQFALHAPTRVFAVMLANLLRNACLYTERGEVTVTVGPDFVRVADTGPGIAADEMERIFQPFVRGRGHRQDGHGVGLSIVRRLSDRFGWPVTLDSTLGVGTAATIRFPNPQPV
jgi:signal transduction histidine kinase